MTSGADGASTHDLDIEGTGDLDGGCASNSKVEGRDNSNGEGAGDSGIESKGNSDGYLDIDIRRRDWMDTEICVLRIV